MDDAIESVASELRSVAMMVFVRQVFVFSAGDTTDYALHHRLDGGVGLLAYSLAEANTSAPDSITRAPRPSLTAFTHDNAPPGLCTTSGAQPARCSTSAACASITA